VTDFLQGLFKLWRGNFTLSFTHIC